MDKKEATKAAVRMIAMRDQTLACIRDNQETIKVYSLEHPDALVKVLANFALSELICCPDIKFVVNDDGS